MSSVLCSVAGGVAVVTLNRPDRLNAVSAGLVDDLLAALDSVASSDARAVVLAGAGRAFCAGHDLKSPSSGPPSRRRLELLQDVTRRLRSLPPVIAAVQGYAIGAGAEFALGCDLILAADDAVFQFPEVGLGLSVTGGASRLLPSLVGVARAKELLLIGERVPAATALEFGLVNAVVPASELADRAASWARSIADKPAHAALIAKRAVDASVPLEPALELEVSHALQTSDASAAEQFRS